CQEREESNGGKTSFLPCCFVCVRGVTFSALPCLGVFGVCARCDVFCSALSECLCVRGVTFSALPCPSV
ncbi:hypothetical protein GBAR_LOCUS18863, partial [Geodia barretti]